MFPLQRVIGEYGLYNYNVTIVKQLGDCVKVSHCRSIRKKGLEVEKPEAVAEPKENQSDYAKLEASISRAKRMVKEYALCNEWDFCYLHYRHSQKFGRYDLVLIIRLLVSLSIITTAAVMRWTRFALCLFLNFTKTVHGICTAS